MPGERICLCFDSAKNQGNATSHEPRCLREGQRRVSSSLLCQEGAVPDSTCPVSPRCISVSFRVELTAAFMLVQSLLWGTSGVKIDPQKNVRRHLTSTPLATRTLMVCGTPMPLNQAIILRNCSLWKMLLQQDIKGTPPELQHWTRNNNNAPPAEHFPM